MSSPSRWNPRAERSYYRVKQYFDHDGRYYLEDHVGSGTGGDVFRLRKANAFAPGLNRVVVKIPSDNFQLSADFARERENLMVRKLMLRLVLITRGIAKLLINYHLNPPISLTPEGPLWLSCMRWSLS